MDLLAVDRGNKRPMECFESVVGDLVPRVLDLFDLLCESLNPLHVVEQLQQQTRPFNALAGMLLEEIKEAVLFGQERTEWHSASFAYLVCVRVTVYHAAVGRACRGYRPLTG